MKLNKDTSHNLGVFGLDNITYSGNEIQLSPESIILPASFQYLDDNTLCGIGFITQGLQESEHYNIQTGDTATEKKIAFVTSLLSGANIKQRSGHLGVNIKKCTDQFFDTFSKHFGNYPLDVFLQEIINRYKGKESLPDYESLYREIYTQYQSFKNIQNPGEYSEWKGSDGGDDTGNDAWGENDEEMQQDIQLGESMEGEDPGVFMTYTPKISGAFFATAHRYETFDREKKRWVSSPDIIKTEVTPMGGEKTSTLTGNFKQQKIYSLPLPTGYTPINFDTTQVRCLKNSLGVYSVKVLQAGEISIDIGTDFETDHSLSDENNNPIYTGNEIPDIGNDPFEILRWIQKNKIYNETHQKTFVDNAADTNEYIEIIFNAPEIECMSANTLFVALCRRAGFPARRLNGISLYHTNEETGSKTHLSSNRGHAISEVYIDGQWVALDATPSKVDTGENNKNEGQSGTPIEEMCGSIGEEAQNASESSGDDSEKHNSVNYGEAHVRDAQESNTTSVQKILGNDLPETAKSALEFVAQDAKDIIEYIQKILEERKKQSIKRQLAPKKQKNKQGVPQGKLLLNPQTIQRVATGNPNIFTAKSKAKNSPNDDIDTRIDSISLAIDISGSMGNITGNWERGSKLDYAYLTLALLTHIAQSLDIDFSVTLFSDIVNTIDDDFFDENTFQRSGFHTFQNICQTDSAGNTGNSDGIQQSLKTLVSSKKGVHIILSDGDGNDTAFFNTKTQEILNHNTGVCSLGYGLGSDACQAQGFHQGKSISVIASQMRGAQQHRQARGFESQDYTQIVTMLKQHLTQLMTQSHIDLSKI